MNQIDFRTNHKKIFETDEQLMLFNKKRQKSQKYGKNRQRLKRFKKRLRDFHNDLRNSKYLTQNQETQSNQQTPNQLAFPSKRKRISNIHNWDIKLRKKNKQSEKQTAGTQELVHRLDLQNIPKSDDNQSQQQ